MAKRLLPLAAMEKILKQCGAERVSDKAKAALKTVVEDMAEEIAEALIAAWDKAEADGELPTWYDFDVYIVEILEELGLYDARKIVEANDGDVLESDFEVEV